MASEILGDEKLWAKRPRLGYLETVCMKVDDTACRYWWVGWPGRLISMVTIVTIVM